MIVAQTERLILRNVAADDAAFILRLLNEPSFLRFIGDRGVRTLDDARRYIAERFTGSYERHGFGMWIVERRDMGFAFLPEHWAQGYAFESALAVRDLAFGTLGLPRLLAIANPDNVPSIRLLERLGMALVERRPLSEGAAPVCVYAIDAQAASDAGR